MVAAMAAHGQVAASAGAGVFSPYKGTAGPSVLAQVLTSSHLWRFGGEIEYRNYKSTLFDVDNVEINSVSLRGIVHYRLRAEGVVPYLGGGIGLNVNVIDAKKIERESFRLTDVSDAGVGIGFLVLGGVEIPLGARVSLFGEGRVGADVQLTQQKNGGGNGDIGVENLGGVTGVAGVRVYF